MPVVAMQVTDKQAHERTDNLFIYTFSSPGQEDRQIVANLTNVYEVGDTVAVALEGTHLPGVEIKPRKVFGIPSSGMALGPVEAELDADLSDQFDADRPLRTFQVKLTVEVEARYADDAQKAVKKAVKQDRFQVDAVE